MLKIFFSVMGASLSLSQQSAMEIINEWRSRPPHELIFDSGQQEIRKYLQAIAKLQQSNAKGANDKLIAMAVDRLRGEFEGVLRSRADLQTGPVSTTDWSSVTDSTANIFRYEDYLVAEALNEEVIEYLRNIAEIMNSSGRVSECVKAYKIVRKGCLQSQLKRLRFDELRGDHNQRRYVHDELKVKMDLWVQLSKICVKILFEKEKKVCGDVFGNVGEETKDDCFVGTVKDSAMLLFRFAEEMSLMRHPFDKMGVVLGFYDAFCWVLPAAEDLFMSEQGKGIRDDCKQTLSRIENDVVRMMYDLENAVLHEPIIDVSEGRGAVHRSTVVVIEQIEHIVRNKNLLTLIESPPSLDFGDIVIHQQEFLDYSNNSSSVPLQHLGLIILVFLRNIKMKAGSHQDPCLGHVFVMNNVRCLLKTMEGSEEMQVMLGDHLLDKLSDHLVYARGMYEKTACGEFLRCLRKEGLYINLCCMKKKPLKAAIKRRLVTFNQVFEKIKDVQCSWTIQDDQLREEVRRSMSEILVPAYRGFLQDFSDDPETREIVEGNRKHSVEDLELLVQHKLFAQC